MSDRISVVMSVRRTRGVGADPRDLIAGEILATSFEFGDRGDAEIGDGVRVAIAKA